MAKKNRLRPVPIETAGRIRAGFDSLNNPNEQHPAFSFQYVEWKKSFNKAEKEEKAALLDRLCKLSQLSWQDITQSQRHGLGTEKIDRTAINASLPAIVTPDVNLLAIRFSGLKPMVGFRNGRIFLLVMG